MSRALAIVALLALAGCGGPPPPPRQSAAGATPAKQATAAVEPVAAPAQPDWVYSSVGKRDPFRGFLAEAGTQGVGLSTRCASPLGRYEVEQLKLVAVVTGLEDPVGMVEAPNGVGYPLRRGVCVGKNGGVVASVRTGEVIVTEWALRADGTRDATQTVLRLPKEAGFNPEELAP